MGVSLRSWPIRTRIIAGAAAIGLPLLVLLVINGAALASASVGDSAARLARANLLVGLVLLGACLSWGAMFWSSIAKPFVRLCGDVARAVRDEAAGLPKPEAADELGKLQASVYHLAERLRDGSATAASLAQGELRPARGEGALAANLDQTMQTLRSLFTEFAQKAEAARAGKPIPRMDESSLRGAYRDVAAEANALVGAIADTQSVVAASARALAQGDALPPIAPLLSANARKVLEAHGQASQACLALAEEFMRVGRAIPETKGRARVIPNKYTGVYMTLAEAFNQGLEQQALLAQTAHAELRTASHKLTGNLSDLAETFEALRNVAAASTHRASSVGRASMDVVVAVRKTCDSLRSTSDAMNAVSAATEQLSTTVTRIASDTETARSGTVEAVRCSSAAKARVGALERAADDIGIVTEAIAEISAQTNLLALNATIEAVRAGASGRGFAVVAKEIKDLAQQTASATEDIRLRVESIRASTKATVDDIDRVLGVNSRVDELVGSIASAIEQQSVTTKEIARHISATSGQIGDVTREARHGERIAQGVAPDIAKTATTTQEIGAILTKIGAKSQTLTELATELRSTVDALSR